MLRAFFAESVFVDFSV